MSVARRGEGRNLTGGVGEGGLGLSFDLNRGAEVDDGPTIGENSTG